ncbi:MAG: type II secretion system GspH family protein [Planctomycetaceae bacterium]|nr:type II secretion system GspH family protein [Planctomycetaceae bacterium]
MRRIENSKAFTRICRGSGFTLIELLVVIAIIALLLSIIMPALKKAKDQARKVICMSHLGQLGKGIEAYEGANDFKRFVARRDAGDTNLYWMGKIAPYVGDEHYGEQFRLGQKIDLLLCPSAPYSKFVTLDAASGLVVSGTGQVGTAAMPWEWKWQDNLSTISSYGINSFLAYDSMYEDTFKDGVYTNWTSTPGNVPLFGCTRWLQGYPRGTDRVPASLSGQQMFDTGNVNHMERFCIDRHSKQINIIYKDLSVESVPLAELWQKQWHKGFKRPTGAITLPAQ